MDGTNNENLQGEFDGLRDHATVAGSVSVLHTPTGLNVSLAGGQRRYIQASETNTGAFGTQQDSLFGYLKLGWRTELFAVGTTAFYTEHGWYRDFHGRDTNAGNLGLLDGGPGAHDLRSLCAGAPTACLVSGSDAAITGAGIVQYIEAAGAQLYLGARHHEADIGLVEVKNSKVRAAPISGFDTFIGGLLIEF